MFWYIFCFHRSLTKHNCDVLFVPGGLYFGFFRPFVAVSQNLLPFQFRELFRFGFRLSTLRYLILRSLQSSTFRRSDGIIFLSEYAKNKVTSVVGPSIKKSSTVIPHGIHPRFILNDRIHLPFELFSNLRPLRLVYVSIINFYKHQWHVVEAVWLLRQKGYPVTLDLIGPNYPPAFSKLLRTLEKYDKERQWVRLIGPVPYADLPSRLSLYDIGVFASSCENCPNILIEMMANALPLACSKCGPMPEVLGSDGVYFDPEYPPDIAAAVESLLISKGARVSQSLALHNRACRYSWESCAEDTVRYLLEVCNSKVASA